jgi:cytochrome c peroxidase
MFLRKPNITFLTLLSLALLVLAVSRCKPDPKGPTTGPPPYQATPFDLEVPQGFPPAIVPPDNPMTVEGVRLGRHLFYEEALSGDNSMSCASCHMQQRAFTDGKAVSKGIDGIAGRRSAMPLFNLAFEEKFFWDGRSLTLEEQALIPIEDPIELNADLDTVIMRLESRALYQRLFEEAFGSAEVTADRMAKAIAQFERTLISANSKFDKVMRLKDGTQFTPLEDQGRAMYFSEVGDCFHCHGAAETSYLMGAFGRDLQFANNGLKMQYQDEGRAEVTGKPSDVGKFKVPSVRNVEFSFPYMHDGSIPNLDSLVGFYNFGGHKHPNIDPNMKAAGEGRGWTPQQRNALKAFLQTFTDYEFLQDTAYSNPFQ